MHKSKTSRLFLGTYLLVAMTVISLFTTTSHATAASSRPAVGPCAVLQVTLHGSAAPDSQCLSQTAPSSNKGVIPNTSADKSCPTNDLVLYWNSPIGVHPNYLLCLIGFGELNLNQSLFTQNGTTTGTYLNWNDQASAWWTGCADVYFFTDINEGGNWTRVVGSEHGLNSPSGNFPYGNIPNDSLSSVLLVDEGLC